MNPRIEPPEKKCSVCHRSFGRSNEGMSNFRRRQTCGLACKRELMAAVRTMIPHEEVARRWNESRTVDDAAKAIGVSIGRLRGLRNTARAKGLKLKRQRRPQGTVVVHGVLMTLSEVAEMTGCHVETIRYRVKRGLDVIMRPRAGRRTRSATRPSGPAAGSSPSVPARR